MSGLRRAALALGAAAAHASGAVAWRRRRRQARRDHRVFVLEYHDVCGGDPRERGPEREGVISADRLRAHVRQLRRWCRLVPLADAAALLAEPRALAEDLAVLTFDDGYAGNFAAAWPVLRDEGVPATIFLATGFLDGGELWFDFARRALAAAMAAEARGRELAPALRARLAAALGWPLAAGRLPAPRRARVARAVERLKYLPIAARTELLDRLREADLALPAPARPLSWAQARQLQAAGVELGCHTVSHPILSLLPPAAQEEEIRRSRERVRQETGVAPVAFAYPNGSPRDFTPATRERVLAAGFAVACTSVRGSNRPGCDPLRLRRIGVGSDPGFVLTARLAGLLDEEARRRWRRPSGGAAAGLGEVAGAPAR
jgi:peptidoglycan/xylan/chitin deacetylase (PgdA/CDA1 family)